jgi:ACS family hexuronate transporter-like MFS transporter
MAEAAGIPASGKAIYQYLRPPERALGNALNQAGVSLGMLLAPPLATFIALRFGWRQAFVVTGAFGLLWIPLWLGIARRSRIGSAGDHAAGAFRPLLRDPRLWSIALANALSMIGYSLWVNWTTLYLVDARLLSLQQAAWYAWIPPVFFALGGAAGGWGSLLLIQRGCAAVSARFRVCLAAAALSLITAAVPAAPSLGWSMAGISLSVFAVAAMSVNVYTLPLDIFGGSRAAFAVSVLVSSYGVSQAVISPWFGRLIDLRGYGPVTAIAAVAPLTACAVLRLAGASR